MPIAIAVHLGDHVDGEGEGQTVVDVPLEDAGVATIAVHLDGEPRIVELIVDAGDGAPVDATWSLDPGAVPPELFANGIWLRPQPLVSEVLTLELAGDAPVEVTVAARGAPLAPVRRERSLVWVDPIVVDDPTVVGLARVLAAASADGHGGVLLDRWFRRFATTLHSERAAPAALADEIASAQGPDPSTWDLDALPFIVSGVHNRIDLAARSGGCGELRVSFASVHPLYAPFHLIFLFRQEPREDDIGPDGSLHCAGTARRWSRLTDLDGASFAAAAAARLDDSLRFDAFLLAESVELTVSPWEWRQWKAVAVDELDNPPLFQTVATPHVNEPGALRDDFLTWVADNAEGLAERSVEIPSGFRVASAQAPPSVPLEPLDLAGLDPDVLAAYPDIGHSIEIVGCPTCHTDDANFVHTTVQRTFSPFYDRELDARAARIDAQNLGPAAPTPAFGPLQTISP